MRNKNFIILLIVFLGLFFFLSLEVFPDNLQFRESLDTAFDQDIIIIFNSGGWGNTPLEEAEDFAPIIEGIQETLKNWNYNSVVISYERTKDSFLGEITGAREFLTSFRDQSKKLAKEIESFLEDNSKTKIVMAGLSDGAAFVDRTMENLSRETQDKVYAIEAGVPFWRRKLQSENILRLDNNGQDSLAKGEIKILLSALLRAPPKWFLAQVFGRGLTFSQAIHAPGHDYEWSKVGSEITFFLESKFPPLLKNKYF